MGGGVSSKRVKDAMFIATEHEHEEPRWGERRVRGEKKEWEVNMIFLQFNCLYV